MVENDIYLFCLGCGNSTLSARHAKPNAHRRNRARFVFAAFSGSCFHIAVCQSLAPCNTSWSLVLAPPLPKEWPIRWRRRQKEPASQQVCILYICWVDRIKRAACVGSINLWFENCVCPSSSNGAAQKMIRRGDVFFVIAGAVQTVGGLEVVAATRHCPCGIVARRARIDVVFSEQMMG